MYFLSHFFDEEDRYNLKKQRFCTWPINGESNVIAQELYIFSVISVLNIVQYKKPFMVYTKTPCLLRSNLGARGSL